MVELPYFSGDQMRLARMICGFSLEDLAQRVSTSRQYLHQLETGAKQPNSEMQDALAIELGVLARFFYLNGGPSVRPNQIHFRKQQTTPVSIVSQVVARGTLLDRLAEKLDDVLSLPVVNFPVFSAASISDSEQAASLARRHWGLGNDAPISNMIRVAENAGAIVTYFQGISDRVDALSIDRRRPIIVRGDAKASLCRQRFDLAHEIGHLVMHQGIDTGDRFTEDQAHRFAGAFLIPAGSFLSDFPRSQRIDWTAVFQMKQKWKVSARAIIRRAYDLKIISASQYRTANIQLVKTGQSKVEKYDDELPLERPELLDAALSLASRKRGRLEGLLKEIGLAEGMFRAIVGRDIQEFVIFETASVLPFPSS